VPEPAQLLVFVIAAVVLIVTPGPDILFMLACTLRGGLSAGLAGLLGVCAGCLVHACLAAFGVAGLLVNFPPLFEALRLLGAAYLLYLGLATLIRRAAKNTSTTVDKAMQQAETGHSDLARGFMSNILNPKVSMFYLAFLPQFVDPRGNATLQSLVLASIHILLSLVLCGLFVYAAARAQNALRGLTHSPLLRRWLPGAVFCGLGLKLAFERKL
jgi:threonine/homoserine/homoserine lactone efflux protein